MKQDVTDNTSKQKNTPVCAHIERRAQVLAHTDAQTLTSTRVRKRSSAKPPVLLTILAVLACAIVLVALVAPAIVPYDPYAQDLSQALMPPSGEHLAGTDRYGRDLFSRILVGAQSSIFYTFLLVAISFTLGSTIGMIAGWKSGKLDSLLMRTSDIFLAFPGLVFALAIAGTIGGGMFGAVLALAAISWPKYARLSRSLTLSQKNLPYIDAARLSGCTTLRLIATHLLPNIAGPLIVTAMLDIGTMMMELAGLSFLGLGAQPPIAEWGSMLSDSRSLLQSAPWTIAGPGVAIFITVAVFNLLGDLMRDYIEPSKKQCRKRWKRREKQKRTQKSGVAKLNFSNRDNREELT